MWLASRFFSVNTLGWSTGKCHLPCGPPMRRVRGMVTAATLATAEAWAWRQQALLTGDADQGHYPTRPQLDRDYEFQPRVDGIAQGQNANVQLYRVNFSFGEILPNYPAPN